MMIPLTTFAQNNINGTVQNELHEPMIAAKVVIENTYLSATTNLDGQFVIRKIKDGDYVISITAYGYETLYKEVSISNNQTYDFQFEMKESPQMVKEMLVLAVRADDKTPTTYSNIKNKEIQENN